MKKILIPLLFITGISAWSQPKMQGTIKPGAGGTIDIYLKSSASFTQKDEAMTFSLAVPASVQPAPSIGTSGVASNGTGLVTGISGIKPNFVANNLGCTVREVVTSLENINAIAHYVYTFIFAGTALNDHTWTAGVEQLIFTIAFDGCTSGCGVNYIKMVSLPNGGNTQNAYWYFQPNTVGDITNYSSPFYSNQYTSLLINGGSSNGSVLSMVQFAMPLPVHLQKFEAAANNCNVIVSWQSAEETNLAYYSIERSMNAQDYFEIGRVNSSNAKTYSFKDNSSFSGKSFYRLRIADKDGKYAYSAVKEINTNCPGKGKVLVFPNPAKGIINILLSQDMQAAKITLLNAEGKTVARNEGGTNQRAINVKGLAAGAYTLQVVGKDKMVTNVKVLLE